MSVTLYPHSRRTLNRQRLIRAPSLPLLLKNALFAPRVILTVTLGPLYNVI